MSCNLIKKGIIKLYLFLIYTIDSFIDSKLKYYLCLCQSCMSLFGFVGHSLFLFYLLLSFVVEGFYWFLFGIVGARAPLFNVFGLYSSVLVCWWCPNNYTCPQDPPPITKHYCYTKISNTKCIPQDSLCTQKSCRL